MNNPEYHQLLEQDPEWSELCLPVDRQLGERVHDAEFLIRKDGLVVNVEGWYHPPDYIVGEVLYAPDEQGDKIIFGQRYRKVTLFPRTYDPVPYDQRGHQLGCIDPLLNQASVNPFFARYKQILPYSDFIAHLPSQNALERALRFNGHDALYKDFENLMRLIDVDLATITLGLTGAPLLGSLDQYHDLDLVFSGTTQQNIAIARKMRDLVIHEPDRRLFEGGKAWQIRFFNDFRTLMCTFFTYPDRSLAPLNDFSMLPIEDDVIIEGEVSDDTHTMYTPTIVELADAGITKNGELIQRFSRIPLVVYHTASRGDCYNGDIVRANGSLVEISQAGADPYLAVCVIEREDVRNLTPPWEGYYAA